MLPEHNVCQYRVLYSYVTQEGGPHRFQIAMNYHWGLWEWKKVKGKQVMWLRSDACDWLDDLGVEYNCYEHITTSYYLGNPNPFGAKEWHIDSVNSIHSVLGMNDERSFILFKMAWL